MIMQNSQDKNIEKLVENLMSGTSLDSPSIDFTAKVMSGVFKVEKKKAFIYKPIIPKRAWIIILGTVVALFAFLLFKTAGTSTGSNFNWAFLNWDKLPKVFSGFDFSTLTANVVFTASIMAFIQVFLLKTYFNKRFQK